MNVEDTENWKNLGEPGLRSIKIKPVSLLTGIIFGTSGANYNEKDAIFNSQLENLLLNFSLPLSFMYPIIYKDNRAGGRNHEDALYNTNLCALNYVIGYGFGACLKNLFS